MRIVALVPGGIGDQILFFPTLDDLHRYYPDAQIDVVVEPKAKGAYRVCKTVKDVIPFDFTDRNSLADWGNLIGAIRDRECDVAISLEQKWFTSMLLWLSGINTRIGYTGTGNVFLTNSVPLKRQQYTAAMYHDLLQGLGIKSPCPEMAINVPKIDIDWAESEQKRLGIQDSGYVLIHGGSSQVAQKATDRSYPTEKWQQVIQGFQQRQPDMPVVVIKEPEDEQLEQLLQSSPGVKVTSPTDIGKLAAMVASADLLVCTDDVPMQIAVAVQTYTIALFGPTEPQQLLPQSDRFLAIKSPTTKTKDIAPQTVIEKIWGG